MVMGELLEVLTKRVSEAKPEWRSSVYGETTGSATVRKRL